MENDVLLAVVEVTPESLYNDARNAARNTLALGRRDINRLTTMNLSAGDDCRADSEFYIAKLEALMDLLEKP